MLNDYSDALLLIATANPAADLYGSIWIFFSMLQNCITIQIAELQFLTIQIAV